LVALGMWLGVVVTEVLFEFACSDADALRAAARFHYNVDNFGELPILVGADFSSGPRNFAHPRLRRAR
jgi:hypothetical protein